MTGFKHQIRIHLADALHCPIMGDYKFASPVLRMIPSLGQKLRAMKNSRGPMCLHAHEVKLDLDPDKRPIVITAPPPHHFTNTVKELKLKLPTDWNSPVAE